MTVVAVALGVTVSACTTSGGPPKPADPALASGWQVFKDHCATCHGTKRRRRSRPEAGGHRRGRLPEHRRPDRRDRERQRRRCHARLEGPLSTQQIHASPSTRASASGIRPADTPHRGSGGRPTGRTEPAPVAGHTPSLESAPRSKAGVRPSSEQSLHEERRHARHHRLRHPARGRRHRRHRRGPRLERACPASPSSGLPDASCREARDRVRAALLSSRRRWPQQRVTVNLAPTGVRKTGAGLDLAIAVGPARGRRADPGRARPTMSASWASSASTARSVPWRARSRWSTPSTTETVVVAPGSAVEAQLVGRHVVRAVATLAELLASLCGDEPWPPLPSPDDLPPLPEPPDLADVRGQPLARRALEVAAAGGHHLLMTGAPGSGKTMLAQRLVGLLPDLDLPDALETTRVHSAVGVALPPGGLVRRPPFRAPHHGASAVAMVGGGGSPTAARRDLDRHQRRPLPRRDGRVPRRCARRAPPTSRGGRSCASPVPACGSPCRLASCSSGP